MDLPDILNVYVLVDRQRKRSVGVRLICSQCGHPVSATDDEALVRAWQDHIRWKNSIERLTATE
jgi:hypothetical protein